MEWIIIWPVLCFVVAWVASQKGRSGVGFFFLSFFLSPLIGQLVLIAVPARDRAAPQARAANDLVLCHACNRPRRVDSMFCPHCHSDPAPKAPRLKKCPMCAELIQPEAVKCRYCGAAPARVPIYEATTMGTCPGCRKLRASNVLKCVYCGDTAPVAAD